MMLKLTSFKAEMFGCSLDELVGSSYSDRIHPSEKQEGETTLRRLVTGEMDHVYCERHYLHQAGSDFWGYLSGRRLESRDGTVDSLVFIIIDVTELRMAMVELRKAKEVAEAANETKRRFLMNMSHELRTPMNGVLGMIQLALFDNPTDTQRFCLETAAEAGNRLVKIMNDILDLTKAEARKLTILQEPFDLWSTVIEVINILDLEARRKGIILTCMIAPEVPKNVIGDRLRLQQVLTNLIANAVKFTTQGKVIVDLNGAQGPFGRSEITFTVSDTGVGIPADKQHLLFQAFSQVDDSLTRPYDGTGLGLIISKEIVVRMGGSITCTSKERVGSVFTVTIPFETEGPPYAMAASQLKG